MTHALAGQEVERFCRIAQVLLTYRKPRRKEWVCLYRAVDSRGNTLDFFFGPTRNAKAARQFLLKTLAASHSSEPRVIDVDKHAASHKA
jgi:transposase-like protein